MGGGRTAETSDFCRYSAGRREIRNYLCSENLLSVEEKRGGICGRFIERVTNVTLF